MGWMQDGEMKTTQPQLAYTFGFIYKKTKEHLVIASTFDDHKASNHHFQIPRKMIREQRLIAKRGKEFPTTESNHAIINTPP